MIGSKVIGEKVLLIWCCSFLLVLVRSSPLPGNVQRMEPPRENGSLPSHPNPAVPPKVPEISNSEAEEFLKKFRYGDVPISNRGSADQNSSAIPTTTRFLAFQRESDIPETGQLDNDTKLLMATPRCGVADDQMPYALKWNKRQLTYNIANFPSGQPSTIVRSLMRQAFNEWSAVTNLDFREVFPYEQADIRIGFGGMYHSSRGGTCAFQFQSVLAHAFFPPVGDVHFNTRYYFDGRSSPEMFLNTAVHELGHALGLVHSRSMGALMYPTAINGFTKPQPLDVYAIQQLYGARVMVATPSPTVRTTPRPERTTSKTVQTTQKPEKTTPKPSKKPSKTDKKDSKSDKKAPKFCSLKSIDAAIQQADGSIDVLAGDYFYNPTNGTGKRISSKWPGLPGNIDAAFKFGHEWTYFFKGSRVWGYSGTRLMPGYPRSIKGAFPGLPDNADAALVDGRNFLYVFRGDQYWEYNGYTRKVVGGASSPVTTINLPTVKDGFDAGLNTRTGLMLFKGKEKYQWGSDGLTVGKSSNAWLKC